MESLKNIAKILTSNDNKTHTLPIIIQGAEDKSWRVRLNLAKIFAEVGF
jgi:serine/threonine-protein phosphatase 2A regulatory subunit A